jgi:hypothetical protein
MAGRVYDREQLVVDRDPLKQLAVEVGKFPGLDPIEMAAKVAKFVADFLLEGFKSVTGIDLTGWTSFLDGLPGLDAGKIISGIFGGGLIPGLDASKIISGTFGSFLIPFLDASKIISGIFGGGRIPGLDASKITSGTFADGVVPGLLGLMNGLFGGFTGIFGEEDNATQTQIAEVTAAQTQVLATISAQVAKLQAMLVTEDPAVTIVEDAFEYVGALDPAKWSVIDLGPGSQGSVYCDGHQLYFDQAGTQDRTVLIPYIGADADAEDDLIGVKIVLGDSLGVASTTFPFAHDLILRKNATNTQYTRFRLFPKSWELAAMNAGVKTVIATAALSSQPGIGSIISCDAGTEADHAARTFSIKVNGATWTINDTGAASFVGASHRGRGLGARFGQRVFFGANQQIQPGPIAHWVSENNPIA